jgi:hypothetical protein
MMLAWLDGHAEKANAEQIWKIFAMHGFDVRHLGEACSDHPQCASLRCDNRTGAGCVGSSLWQMDAGGIVSVEYRRERRAPRT